MRIKKDLSNLEEIFPADFSEEQKAKTKTAFMKNLSLHAHKFYNGKIQTLPKAGICGFNWFNVWYTPGISAVSVHIRDDKESSYEISGRGNTVAVISDSTRVLGDGDVTPPGGLGVMEGKAYLMKYLGGVDAFPICIDSKNEKGENDPQKIIDFVKTVQHSFGAVNLEDISQPNCYEVLDKLRDGCDIPVWHDDAQGTACVTLAGLINALKLAEKKISEVRIVFMGAGAANSSIAGLCIKAGASAEKLVLFDVKGGLHSDRKDFRDDKRFYRQWDLCQKTNPEKINTPEEAIKGADVLICLSKPGPDTVKPEWISSMAEKAIVFACANPVPEIYPYKAKEAGAFIVATGRGDFPNQVNNSICFPGILKGALLVRAKSVTDNMAIRAAKSLAEFAEKRGISPDNIVPKMDEFEVFPHEAADTAMQAIEDGVARIAMTREEVYEIARRDIMNTRRTIEIMQKNNCIKEIPREMLEKALSEAIKENS
ncbi:MAG: malate dehydrogenase [Candidatus Cloacimonadota bacterium]|nr:MAG: malate dehydrogenase [Candidatus Cloacimonadota bacterium]